MYPQFTDDTELGRVAHAPEVLPSRETSAARRNGLTEALWNSTRRAKSCT